MAASSTLHLDVHVVPSIVGVDARIPGEDDAAMIVAYLREAADELEKAHLILDSAGYPRQNPESGVPFTLAARIHFALTNDPTGPKRAVVEVKTILDGAVIAEAVAQEQEKGPARS